MIGLFWQRHASSDTSTHESVGIREANDVAQLHATIMFINQLRMKIGIVYGSPETTTGGHALKYYASVRLDVRRVAALKVGEEVRGSRTRVKVVKNKLSPPFQQAEFDIRYGEGIDKVGDLLDTATAQNVIDKNGAYFAFEGSNIGQGRERAREALINDPALYQRISERCRAVPLVPGVAPVPTDNVEEIAA